MRQGTQPEQPERRRQAPAAGGGRPARRLVGSLAAGLIVVGGAGLVDVAAAGATTAGFSVTGALRTPRADATATLLTNGDVLVAGGEDAAGTPLASAERYDPANGRWTTVAPMPLPVSQATATRLQNGDVLVAGGLTERAGTVVPTDATELYDPATGRWSATKGDLHTASFGASAGLLASGQVVYAGGLTGTQSGAGATDVAELYDPASGTWSTTAPLPLGVAGAASATLSDGDVLVAGGETGASGGLTALAEVYRPSSQAWAPVDRLLTPVAAAATSVLLGGDVLVAGGEISSGGPPTAMAQRFDPATGRWSAAGSLPFASYQATATTLSSGEVLYAGGLTSGSLNSGRGTPTSRAATYDASTNAWTPAGDLTVARGGAAAARLGDGDALIAGGRTASGVTGEAERFSGAASGQAPAFTTPAVVRLQAGRYATVTVRATGTPAPRLSESGALPPGMAFREGPDGTATISGVPRPGRAASAEVTIVASNGVGSPAVQHLTLAFTKAPAFTSPSTRSLRAGSSTDLAVTATGSPSPRLTEHGTLPPGLSFRAFTNGTAMISGVPRPGLTGSYHIVIVASNGVGRPAVQRLTLSFVQAPAIISPASFVVKDGQAVHFTIRASGAPAPMLSEQGTLPPGLSFHAGPGGTAIISGTPTAGARGRYPVTITASSSAGPPAHQTLSITTSPSVLPQGTGYRYTTSTGQVVVKGAAPPIAARTPQRPKEIVAMATTPDGAGEYLVSSYGGVFNYGDAPFYGSIAARHLRTRTVAIAVPPSGDGYYEVTQAGNVFNYGKARFYGSTAGRRLPPIAAFAVTPDGRGYWLVTTRGNVYGFGDAHFYGSPAHLRIPPVVAFSPTPSGHGYWVVTVDGGVLTYGDAASYGSLAGRRVPPVSAFAPTADGHGYWIVTAHGNVFNLGDARFFGSSAHTRLAGPVTGFSADFSNA